MQRTTTRLATSLAGALLLAAAPCALGATLEEAQMIIEFNSTDEDIGIQLFLDHGPWKRMKVFDPDDRKIFDVKGTGSLGMLGLTELFFESEEPTLDELPLEDFLGLFPEGQYRFKGRTVGGRNLKGKATFTHVIPEGPILVAPPDGGSVDPANAVIEWEPVADPAGSEIVKYQVIVEREEPTLLVFSADLGPDATTLTVPAEFMLPGTDYKFEVLAVEAGGNQTISEREFSTE